MCQLALDDWSFNAYMFKQTYICICVVRKHIIIKAGCITQAMRYFGPRLRIKTTSEILLEITFNSNPNNGVFNNLTLHIYNPFLIDGMAEEHKLPHMCRYILSFI